MVNVNTKDSGNTNTKPIPAAAGVGLRYPHYQYVVEEKPDVPWLEVHTENFFSEGGETRYILENIALHYPLSFHGVGLSIGSTDGLNKTHLDGLKRLVDEFNPALVSEHLSWGSLNRSYYHDLWPMPYTKEAFSFFVNQVKEVQDYLGRQILIENPSSYIRFGADEINEWSFYAELPEKTGCGLLLDVNNIHVNCHNHGYDVGQYLDAININDVQEIHVAGHAQKTIDERPILIDDHGSAATEDVWNILKNVLQRSCDIPVLFE